QVAPANRLKIGKSNLRLSSDLKSKEATLQVVYDVLKLTPFYKAFQITADVPEIYMQEFWATAKQFEELPFEEEILTFLRDLGHSGEIKCLSGKSTRYDSLRLSQAQILYGMYYKKNIDYAYLLWEEFVYQVETKNAKRGNEMYYPRFTKVIVNFFMTNDQSIPRRNKVNWHFARDDPMFTTIKVVSRHEDTQLYGAIFPNELTNEAIKDSESYKEYYAIASGAEPPKTKASVKKKQKKQPVKTSKDKGLTVLSEVALIEVEQMKLATKGSLIQTHSSHASSSGVDEGTGGIPGVPDVPTYESDDEQISWKSSEEEDDDVDNDDDDDNDDDNDNDDDDDDADNQDDDGQEDDVQEYDRQDDESQGDDDEQTDSDNDDLRVQTPSHYESIDDEESDEVTHGANVEGEELDEEETNEEDEANELYRDMNVNLKGRYTEMTDAPHTIIQTTQIIEDTHVIITLVNPEGQLQSSSMSYGFVSNMLNPSPDTGIDSIFNLNTKSTSLVDVPVTTIAELPLLSVTILPPPPTPLITHLQQTPVRTPTTIPSSSLQDLPNFAVSLIPGIVDAYLANKMHEAVKTAILGANAYYRRLPTHQEFVTEDTEDKSDEETSQLPDWFQKSAKPPTPNRDWNKTLPAAHGPVQPWLSTLAQKEDTRESFNELMDTPLDFSAFVMNRLKVDTLTPELLAGHQYPHDLRKPLPLIPNSRGCQVIPFDHFINNDLVYLSGGVSNRTYITSVMKTKAADYGHIKWIEDLVPNRMWSQVQEFARDVYSKRIIIVVTKLQIVEWNNYKHLDWITIRRDDDKLYTFKEGNFNRLRIQDIEDMQLLLVQGKLTNLTVKECLAFNVSLRMFTRSIVIQRRVEDLQLAYSNPRGFIYHNKDKKNKLMRIDELHKFSDGTLNDVWTALNDRLKGIQMKYLPQTIWKQSDRDKAGAMIQAIDKQLKTRRIMQSLEKFVSGRPYEGDFRLLQRTI
ncbi:hypothetical protein Tco_1449163, partial [Tanacetum coccineum]